MKELDKTTHIQIGIKLGIEQGIAIKPENISIHSSWLDGKKEWYVALKQPRQKDITIWQAVCEEAYWDAIRCKSQNKPFIITGNFVECTCIQPLWTIKSPYAKPYINLN